MGVPSQTLNKELVNAIYSLVIVVGRTHLYNLTHRMEKAEEKAITSLKLTFSDSGVEYGDSLEFMARVNQLEGDIAEERKMLKKPVLPKSQPAVVKYKPLNKQEL